MIGRRLLPCTNKSLSKIVEPRTPGERMPLVRMLIMLASITFFGGSAFAEKAAFNGLISLVEIGFAGAQMQAGQIDPDQVYISQETAAAVTLAEEILVPKTK